MNLKTNWAIKRINETSGRELEQWVRSHFSKATEELIIKLRKTNQGEEIHKLMKGKKEDLQKKNKLWKQRNKVV